MVDRSYEDAISNGDIKRALEIVCSKNPDGPSLEAVMDPENIQAAIEFANEPRLEAWVGAKNCLNAIKDGKWIYAYVELHISVIM